MAQVLWKAHLTSSAFLWCHFSINFPNYPVDCVIFVFRNWRHNISPSHECRFCHKITRSECNFGIKPSLIFNLIFIFNPLHIILFSFSDFLSSSQRFLISLFEFLNFTLQFLILRLYKIITSISVISREYKCTTLFISLHVHKNWCRYTQDIQHDARFDGHKLRKLKHTFNHILYT